MDGVRASAARGQTPRNRSADSAISKRDQSPRQGHFLGPAGSGRAETGPAAAGAISDSL